MTGDAWDRLRESLPLAMAEMLVRELEARHERRATCRLALLLDIWRGVPRPAARVTEVRNAHVLA